MDDIILIGGGGHCRSCIDVIELTGKFKITGLVEKDKANIQESLGYRIIGTDSNLEDLRQKYCYALVTVGQIKSPATRIRLFQHLQKLDYQLPVIVSPNAYVSKNARIGEGTIIMHDAIVNANSKVGKNCIINNKVLIEHDAQIGDHSHIATGAIVNGEVSVGRESFVGSGTVTKQSVNIGSYCIIGAGAIIKKDIESKQIIKN